MKRCPVCGEISLSGILCPVCGSMLTDTGGEISRLKINKRSAFHDSIRWKKPDPGDSSGSASVSGLKSTVGKKRADTPRTPPPEEPPHEKEASGYEGISFPGWEVVRKIGEGSFGGVYEIQRILPGGRVEKCALKKLTVPKDNGEIQELYAQSFNTKNITAHFKNQMQELVSEYALTQDLCGCKNVVTCHDVQCVQHSDGIGWDIYIRMELLKPLAQVGAFSGCTALSEVTLPESMRTLSSEAFQGTALESISVPSACSLGSNAVPLGCKIYSTR